MLNFWNWIINFGISAQHPEENGLINSYNIMSIISIAGSLFIIFLALYLNFQKTYIVLICIVLTVYCITLIANYYGKIYLARYVISLGSPIWNNGLYVIVGGYFCQGLATLAAIAITYVGFQKKPKTKNILIAIQIILFVLSNIFINIFGPICGVIDFPYDETMVFFAGLGWTIILLKNFDKDRNIFLKNLKANNTKLLNTTEELERFTYIASHDLKSPLRTMISFIGLIKRDLDKNNFENLNDNLDFVKSGAVQMNNLLQDISEISKFNNLNKVKYSLIDLNSIMEKVKYNLQSEIKQSKAKIIIESLPIFFCNEFDFILLFQNFIQNGIKYNNSKYPIINITSNITNNKLYLSISDNGIGIEKEYHDQIFQFFIRLHNSDKYQGTGLGLGLCKKIINSYKGEVKVASKINNGTTFTLIFPIANEHKDYNEMDKI